MKLTGELSAIIAGVLSGFVGLFSTILVAYGISSFEQTFFRALVPFLILFAFLYFHKQYFYVKRGDTKLFVLVGFFKWPLTIAAYLSAFALGTPLAIAAFLLYLFPVYTVILSRIFLKEKATSLTIFAVVFAIAGAFLLLEIWNIDFSAQYILGYFCAFIAGIGLSLETLTARKLGKTYHQYTTMFYCLFFGLVMLVPVFLLFNISLPAKISSFTLSIPIEAFALLICFGIITLLFRDYLYFRSLRFTTASRTSVLLMTEPLSAALVGFLVFNQVLSAASMLGIVLILVALILIAAKKK